METTRHEDAFVLRVWREPGQTADDRWRAVVQHLRTGERRYFTNYGELCEFLERFRRADTFT